MAELTSEQRYAVECTHRPLVLLAGAGSGKTTVLVERYLKLLDEGAKPNEILTVTFTVDAAGEMRERIAKRLRDQRKTVFAETVETLAPIGTLHSFCHSLIEQYGELVGLPPIRGIVTAFDAAERFDAAYRRWFSERSPEDVRFLVGNFSRHELRSLFRDLYDSRRDWEAALSRQPADDPHSERLTRLAELARGFCAGLEAGFLSEGLYGFDDLETGALRILDGSADARAKLAARFRHVLVDEFQDTSPTQWEILRRILGDDWNKLFIVGDPKQSIYSFRQADYRLFLEVAAAMPERNGEVRELSANFRSAPPLVDAVNGAAAGLFAGSAIPFGPMAAGGDSTCDGPPVRLVTFEAGGRRADGAGPEADALVADVRARLEAGLSPSDFAVLFRAGERMELFASRLEAAGIPVESRRTVKLFERYSVVDVANFLEAVADPLDDLRLAALLRSPYVGMSLSELEQLNRREEDSLFAKLTAARLPQAQWLLDFLQGGSLELEDALRALFSTGGWPEEDDAWMAVLGPLGRESMTVLEASRRLRAWAKEELIFSRESGSEGVRLMTVHGAKGLEFPHVYLADTARSSPRRSPLLRFDPQSPPGVRFREGGEACPTAAYEKLAEEAWQREQEESKRVLYVALTRAKESLTVLVPSSDDAIPKNSWAQWLLAAFPLT